MDYICLDLGDKRVGIALSRENIAFAHSIVERTRIIEHLKKLFQEQWDISSLIVGLPYDLYGKKLHQLQKTQRFIEKLKNIFPEKEIIGHDERFSSFVAQEGYNDHRDDIAAQCILQSYIDSISLR